MKVLVTGADGFIGSHVVEALLARGHDVRAMVLYNSFNSWGWLDEFDDATRRDLDVFAGDVRDPHGVDVAVSGCDVVLHLAALVAIPYSYHSPDTYVDVNVKGTLNVLQAARRHGTRRVVHTSTSEVYGTAQYVPIDERHPLHPQSPYAASKVGADQMALAFHAAFGTPVGVIRPFNTYGPRQSARAVIPTIITQIAAGRPVRLGALRPTRDFTYVTDTAAGFVAAAESDAIVGTTTNLGSGFEISVGDTAALIAEVMGARLALEHDDERVRPAASEVERLHASIDKARAELHWRPSLEGRDGFRTGLERTVAWFTDARNLARYKAERYNI